MERSLNLLDYFTYQSGEEPIKNVWKGGGPLKKKKNLVEGAANSKQANQISSLLVAASNRKVLLLGERGDT